MLLSKNIKVSKMNIKNYNGDGISFQQCINVNIQNSKIEGNMGNGIHPGSGSVKSIIKKNSIKNNKLNGIFYCLRVSSSSVVDNLIKKIQKMEYQLGIEI